MTNAPNRDLVFVFDMAGVLIEWNMDALYGPMFASSGRDLEEFYSRVLTRETLDEISAGKPAATVVAEQIEAHPLWKSEIESYWASWDDMVVGSIDGTVSVVEELKERGHRVYVLGNWGRDEFERARGRFPFLEVFDDILLSGDCGVLKPDTKIFELAEKQFRLVPANSIFIDDRADNVQAAINRNWNGIVFENPRQLYLVLMDYGIL